MSSTHGAGANLFSFLINFIAGESRDRGSLPSALTEEILLFVRAFLGEL